MHPYATALMFAHQQGLSGLAAAAGAANPLGGLHQQAVAAEAFAATHAYLSSFVSHLVRAEPYPLSRYAAGKL